MSALDALFRLLFGRRGTTSTPRRSPPAPPPPPPPPPYRPTPTRTTPDLGTTNTAPLPPASPPPPPPPPPPPAAGGSVGPGPNYLASLVAQSRAALTRADFEAVAARLQCEWEAVAAVARVESGPLGGFGSDGRPIILFERHLFSRKTNSQYDASNPNISNRTPGGYPRSQADRWAQMAEAYALAPDAAIESASYGRFQILGQNYGNLSMSGPHEYVSKMARSERDQLECFEGFVRANGLADELQRKDWAGFARRYNGPAYETNQYDVKMAQAYDQIKNGGTV